MSGVCYPDSLIASIPNLYYYAANNPRCGSNGSSYGNPDVIRGVSPQVFLRPADHQTAHDAFLPMRPIPAASSLCPIFTLLLVPATCKFPAGRPVEIQVCVRVILQ